MSKQLQIRGGTTAEHSTFTGAEREITVDTDKNTVVVHNGAKAGGYPLALWSDITADKTVTVGDTGDYATINEALTELSKLYPLYKQSGYTVEVKLLAGFIMKEQVIIKGIDLGWISITGEDAETTIDAGSFVDIPSLEYHNTNTPTFSVKNGVLPTIGQLFTTINGGSENNGIHLENSKCKVLASCGVKNVGQHGIIATQSSSADIRESIFSGASSHGIYAVNGSTINAKGADASGAGARGIFATGNSTINAQNANASGTGGYGIEAAYGSVVNANSADASNSASFGIIANSASVISARSATATNTGNYSIIAEYNSHIAADYSNCSTDGDPTEEYAVIRGSTLSIEGASGETDTNISVNTLDASGIIYQ